MATKKTAHVPVSEDACVRFGRKIRKLRLARHWTQTDLSVYSGLKRVYLSRVESGKWNLV